MEKQLVVFELGHENFGVDISEVESIIKMQAITRMPQAPRYVEGVTNLRGKVLPVIDLHSRFHLPAQAIDKECRIIVVSLEETEVGMIVDGVSEVLTISEQAVESPPVIATTIDSAFITGIAKIDSRLVILLDLRRVFKSEERVGLLNLAE